MPLCKFLLFFFCDCRQFFFLLQYIKLWFPYNHPNWVFFTELAPRMIQSISCNVRDMLYVCPSVYVWKPCFSVDWRLLVEERISNIGIPLDDLCFHCEARYGQNVWFTINQQFRKTTIYIDNLKSCGFGNF